MVIPHISLSFITRIYPCHNIRAIGFLVLGNSGHAGPGGTPPMKVEGGQQIGPLYHWNGHN